jgi:hypothetical protein
MATKAIMAVSEFNSDGLRETGALLLPEYQITSPPADLFPRP